MTNSVTGKIIRTIIIIGILTGAAIAPAAARDGGSDRPGSGAHISSDCKLHKKLEKHETRVTALQFEYRSLARDLKKAVKGSKKEAELKRRIRKVEKRLSRERDKAAHYFMQISERQFNGISC